MGGIPNNWSCQRNWPSLLHHHPLVSDEQSSSSAAEVQRHSIIVYKVQQESQAERRTLKDMQGVGARDTCVGRIQGS